MSFQPWRSVDEQAGPSGLTELEQLRVSPTVGTVDILILQLHTLQVTKSLAGLGTRLRVCGIFRACGARAATCGVE